MTEPIRAKESAVDSELLVWAVLILTVLVGLESVAAGWLLHKAMASALLVARPLQLMAFIEAFAVLILPFLVLNAALGAWVAWRLSAPLILMRSAMNEIARGNLEYDFDAPDSGLLAAYTADCRKMIETLRRLLYRDRASALKSGDLIAEGQKLIDSLGEKAPADARKAQELFDQARSELSVVNYHFTKGVK